MTDDQWAKDHADGMHQREIVALMRKIDPALQGHERAIILIALMRIMAAMLGPADQHTRQQVIHEIPISIRKILTEMDRMLAASRH